MHVNRRTQHSPLTNAALSVLLSQSAEQSPAQKEYSEFFNRLCEEKGIAHPFEPEPEQTKAFFAELSEKWKVYKETN